MMRETQLQQAMAAQCGANRPDSNALTEVELALVVGGVDDGPVGAGDHNGRSGL